MLVITRHSGEYITIVADRDIPAGTTLTILVRRISPTNVSLGLIASRLFRILRGFKPPVASE